MGTNRRYADAVDRCMDANIVMRSGTPQSLTDSELELSVQSIIRSPQPVTCGAWIRYPDGPVKVDARAVAWTLPAVAINGARLIGPFTERGYGRLRCQAHRHARR